MWLEKIKQFKLDTDSVGHSIKLHAYYYEKQFCQQYKAGLTFFDLRTLLIIIKTLYKPYTAITELIVETLHSYKSLTQKVFMKIINQ